MVRKLERSWQYILLSLFFVVQSFALSVEFKDEQIANSSMLALRTRIVNENGLTVHNVKLRYVFLQNADKHIVLDSGYTAGAHVSLQMVNDTLGYVEILIDSVSQGLFPNASGFYQGLHYSDWSVLEKQKHPSYANGSNFVRNANILLYEGESLVFGEETLLPTKKPSLKIVGFQPEGNAWIDIRNLGNETLLLDGVTLTGKDSIERPLSQMSLNSMEVLRICRNDSACGNIEKRIVMPDFPWGRLGEALLKKDSIYLAYIPWGDEGLFVESAVMAGVWKNVEDYFEPSKRIVQYPVEYVENMYYRIVENASGKKTDEWFSYSDRDNPATLQPVPTPIKLSMYRSENYRLTENDSVTFKWMPVKRAKWYKVVIKNFLNKVIREITTSETSVNVQLEDGNYSWLVYCGEYIDEEGNLRLVESGGIPISSTNIALISKGVNVNVWNALRIDTIWARKDTRSLYLGYGNEALLYGWDAPRMNRSLMIPYDNSRCWLVASQLMNHIYGGDISQDEILYAVRYRKDEPLISPFSVYGADTSEVIKAIKFALRTNDVSRFEGSPPYNVVKNEIDSGHPIYLSTVLPTVSKQFSIWGNDTTLVKNYIGHAMIVYGYVGDADNYALLYAFGDNYGNLTNSVAKPDSIEYYILASPSSLVALHDSRIDGDSDGDGISDFDEIERFATNPFDYDSDGDGIDDKKEIFDYMMHANYGKSTYDKICAEDTIKTKIEKTSDRDGDTFRAENDADDNNNGIRDGLEGDINLQINDMNVPLDYTLFARDHLVINDGVMCFDSELQNKYCHIGSAGKDIFSYNASKTTFLMGVNSHVGNVDVELSSIWDVQTVFLRNSAVIHGNLNMHVLSITEQSGAVTELGKYGKHLKRQSGAYIDGDLVLKYADFFPNKENSWKGDYQCNLPDLDGIQYMAEKIVKNGETFVLPNGAAYKTLRVQGNSTLIIPPGEFYIDSLLQLESGARIEFSNPGESSIVHLNGDIIWRPQSSNQLTDVGYWSSVARGFKLIQHSSKYMYIEGVFGGTIYAPLSKVVLGQVNKMLYGRFFAKDITVHQYAKVFRVDYAPIASQTYAARRTE